jgi:uncharacterized protein YecE (DUF72 family)
MAIWVGTSGYNYPEWKGSFYPAKLPAAKMLPFYVTHFDTVEINNTFYRMPKEEALRHWSDETPERFRLTLKAPQRITHFARLRDCEEILNRFLYLASLLGPKLGAILFQLPPNMKLDLTVFDNFLSLLPPDLCATFEFRHPSWLDPEVYARLRDRNLALCIADSEKASTPLEVTADVGYFRLRDEGYSARDIAGWVKTIREKTEHCREVFVYFKHEKTGSGPAFARRLLEGLNSGD